MTERIKCGIYTRWSPRHPKCPNCQSKIVTRIDPNTYRCGECDKEFPDSEASSSSRCQEQRCREYAAQKGYEVVWVVDEPDTSGKGDEYDPSPEAWYVMRPQLYRAISLLTPEMILLVVKRDRIGRSVHGQGIVRLDVARHGCKIEATDEPNGNTPENRMTEQILAAVAEYDRMSICARTKAAMRIHQKNGRRMGRAEKIPYGYRVDPENDTLIIPDDYEQETIALARSWAESNPKATGYRICQYLDSIGRTRRGGKTWKNASRLAVKITQRS